MESSLQSLKEGEVVHGTVVAVDSDEVLVDIGYKCEGSVPVAEFTDPETQEVQVKVNDEVEVFVDRLGHWHHRDIDTLDDAVRPLGAGVFCVLE